MKILEVRKNSVTEIIMEERGCKPVALEDFNTDELFAYTYKDELFPLSNIDFEWSKKHLQTRSHIDGSGFAEWTGQPICRKTVGDYSLDMEHIYKDNSLLKFPAPVITFIEGRWGMVSGFHRQAAAEQAGFTHYSGIYIVSHPSPTTIPFNFKENGLRESKENWTKTHAMMYIKALKDGENVSIKDWAARHKFREKTLHEVVRAYTMRQTCANKGLPVERFTTNRHYNMLVRLEKLIGPDVFEIAKTAMKYYAKPKDLEDLMSDLEGKSTTERPLVLKKFEKKIRTGSDDGTKKSPREKVTNGIKFAEYITRISNILKKERNFTQVVSKNVPEPKKSVKLVLDEIQKIYKSL